MQPYVKQKLGVFGSSEFCFYLSTYLRGYRIYFAYASKNSSQPVCKAKSRVAR
jgi:hypothetical protein